MIRFGLWLVAIPLTLFAYAYAGYPLVLFAAARARRRLPTSDPAEWPFLTVLIPVYNAEAAIARTLDHVLAADYPRARRRVVVVSDACTDRTDEIVAGYADRGVWLHRQPHRGGKTAAENAATGKLAGDIVVYIDATIVLPPASLGHLVRPFQDPTVGIVSGRDVSVRSTASDMSQREETYSRYEMWVRSLESRFGTIAGATGSLYAARRVLHDGRLPAELTRDFASTLAAYEGAWRTVSVDAATCLVARAPTLGAELQRKARTMAHGLDTLWYYRRLLNPMRHGWFAVMLLSHKLCRWVLFASLPLAVAGVVCLGTAWPVVDLAALPGLLIAVAGIWALRVSDNRTLPAIVSTCGYVAMAAAAALIAWGRFLRRDRVLVWEPTVRRVHVDVESAPTTPSS
ncbi:MAG: glycosyltransferase family 2 protein [Gemmatimonadaceae bacterium]